MNAVMAAALSGACFDGALPQGPLTVAVQPGDLGKQRNACLRSEVGLTGGANLVVDTADFYGRIQLLGALDFRIAVPDTPIAVEFGMEPFHTDTVLAPIPVATSGLGASWLGGTWAIEGDENSMISATARVVLPTATGSQNQRPLGGDLGLNWTYQWTEKTQMHGGLSLYGSRMVGRGPDVPRTALSGLAGVQWSPSPSFALVLDMPISVAWSAPLDYIALSPGVRVAGGPWSLELGLLAPVVGGDRTLVAADLRTAVRFD